MADAKSTNGVELTFRPPRGTPESKGAEPPRYRTFVEAGMRVEIDVPVRLRDGVVMYVDVARPIDGEPVPPIIAWGPYGKHIPNQPERYLPGAVDPKDLSPRARFEAPNPDYWVPNGYAIVNVNPRGTWYSEGKASYMSAQEDQDFYDVIEWAGTQPWSNGKVGLSGVSYLTVSQWRVAALNPPHLAAINPWEGWSDTYREVVYHGGIPDTNFWEYLSNRWGHSVTEVEDIMAETDSHPYFDTFWESKAADLAAIRVPAYVVASWTDHGLHTRGTFEGFKKIKSTHKWLEVHGRKKWAHYYAPENVARAKVFFDRFLKGIDNEISDWPNVRYEIREQFFVGDMKNDVSWPPATTQYKKLFLDGQHGTLATQEPSHTAAVAYDAVDSRPVPSRAEFTFTFSERTDVVGNMALHAFVEADGSNDMDLFVGVHKLDENGNPVPFPFCAQFDEGQVALGWLRVSQRELDAEKSTPEQPVLAHQRTMKLAKGEIAKVSIEILPSGTRFEAGEKLLLVVQGSEVPKHKALAHYAHERSVNAGRHIIHTGPEYPSYLVMPVI
ncbi:CocE/NonD family hydrolase [Pandoraea pnomenusa]|uniref:CocE/NonD family hydrolase n=1 Tax=Pandoraea pnomenusa TaxID=93220 RepID=UPI00333E9A4F